MRKTLMIFLALSLQPALANPEAAVEVQTWLDRDSGGWAYKNSDHAFLVEKEGCRLQWNAVEDKDGARWLSVRRSCPLPFTEQIPLHRAILKAIANRWSLAEFKSISWGPLCSNTDWSWCVPIAKASLQSKEYRDYKRHYPNSRITNLNGLFVKLTNETKSYAVFAELMKEFGITIALTGVEKVFALPLLQSPVYPQMQNLRISGNPRVMYDAGMTYFRINRCDSAPACSSRSASPP